MTFERNKNTSILIFLFFFLFTAVTKAQHGAKYWVQFTDKNNVPYSINEPEKFLSPEAIQRRIKNNCPITEEDLPVSKIYIDSLTNSGVIVKYTSRWFNSATIEAFDESKINSIKNYSFVKAVEKTADALNYKSYILSDKNKVDLTELANPEISFYGYGYTQIKLENGIALHQMGFKGKGVRIAIIDVGFHDADIYVSLDSVRADNRILGTRNFVDIGESVYNAQSHGADVFSIIGANLPGTFVGTAPEASFILLCSEDANSEFPVEEDNWVAAAEYADSAGADVINTSLGYNTFNDPIYNHSWSDLNGESTRISKAATIASSKGIIVVISAGNEGDNSWHYIGVPADAKNILTVGATTSDSSRAGFSSFGPSADGRVKPDVMAMGQGVTIEARYSFLTGGSGTSFSSPIIAGLTACLVQAYPNVMNNDIMEAIRLSANNINNPNPAFGYGIPDYGKAFDLLKKPGPTSDSSLLLFPNPFGNYIALKISSSYTGSVKISCFNTMGKLVFEISRPSAKIIRLQSELQNLKKGIYFFKCNVNTNSWTIKAVKW